MQKKNSDEGCKHVDSTDIEESPDSAKALERQSFNISFGKQGEMSSGKSKFWKTHGKDAFSNFSHVCN